MSATIHPLPLRALLAGALLLASGAAVAAAEEAELVLYNGAVYTVDATRSWAQAVAVAGGRILYVGDDAGARALAGVGARHVDLGGRMLLPGFQDAHAHPAAGGISFSFCTLFEGDSIEAYVALVAGCAQDHPDWPVISGDGWRLDRFPGGLPDKRLLDAVAPDRPVLLYSADGHSLWLNSAALARAGITAETPDPDNGRIDRYPGTSEPSGSLQESAMKLGQAVIPPLTEADYDRAVRFAQNYFNQYGVTAVTDASVAIDRGDMYDVGEAYARADRSGALTLRVTGALLWEPERGPEQVERILQLRQRLATPRFRPGSVKIFLDGVIEAGTAAMLAPYTDRADQFRGELQVEPARLNRVVAELDRLGFQVHFHAIGDYAIRAAFDALQAAREANGARDSRHQLSHIEVFDPSDLARFRELDALANFQPYWAWADAYITDLTIPRIGPERSRWLYPIGSVADTGAMVVFGSDWSVSSGNPLLGIETAVTRREPETGDGQPFFDEERMRLPEAIAAYTIGSAYANFLDVETGSIEAGKRADLIVLDRNLFAIPVAEISEASVLLTLLDGEPVYGDWSLAPQPKSAP